MPYTPYGERERVERERVERERVEFSCNEII